MANDTFYIKILHQTGKIIFFYENQFNSDILKWSLYVFYSYKIYQAVVDVIEFNIKIVREDQAYNNSIEARVTITTRKWVEYNEIL